MQIDSFREGLTRTAMEAIQNAERKAPLYGQFGIFMTDQNSTGKALQVVQKKAKVQPHHVAMSHRIAERANNDKLVRKRRHV